jgi:hypothetical protein
MIFYYSFLVLIFFSLFNRNKKIFIYTCLFFITSILIVSIIHWDIVGSGFDLGLLSSDDRHYFYNSESIDYGKLENWQFRIKNIGYYFVNYIIGKYSIFNPVFEIKIFNVITFVSSIYIFLNSIDKLKNYSDYFLITYSLVLLCFPIYLILAINYKDSLLFSLILMQFSFFNYYMNTKNNLKKFLLIVIFIVVSLFIETIRLGHIYLFIASVLMYITFFNNRKKGNVLKIFFFCFFTSLIGLFIVEFILHFLLGRSLDGYREYFEYRSIVITGIESFDILTIGFLKSIFQLNPFTTIGYLFTPYGEHGYHGIVYIFGVFCSMWLWLFSLSYIALNNFKIYGETKLLFIYLFYYIGMFSYIYNGMIGYRLSFIMYLVVALYTSQIIFIKRNTTSNE